MILNCFKKLSNKVLKVGIVGWLTFFLLNSYIFNDVQILISFEKQNPLTKRYQGIL
jgi:hypothetical protein